MEQVGLRWTLQIERDLARERREMEGRAMGTEQQNSLEAECGESGSSWFHEEADGGCGQQGHWGEF